MPARLFALSLFETMATSSLQVVWLKRDLRFQHHAPFHAAAVSGEPTLALYIHEPSRLGRPDSAQQHRNFVLETLTELRLELASHGGQLLEKIGEAPEVLEALWEKTRFGRLLAYQETTHLQDFARDKAVKAWCALRGVEFVELPHSGVQRGHRFRSEGFQFAAHVRQALSHQYPVQGLRWAGLSLASARHDEVPNANGSDKPLRQKGGRKAAQACLSRFLNMDTLLAYPSAISSPLRAPEGCSRLSAYLAYGVLSDEEVLQALAKFQQDHAPVSDELKQACRFYVERLYWRSSYLQAYEQDSSSEARPDLPSFRGLREQEHVEEWFQAWKEGRTGIPLVDAGMRFLSANGWINMRMRGLLASFALNDLWLDWRKVRQHLALEFLDYEPAIHNSQISIHAGSSRLSGPLIYDAIKQAKDHDPKGQFVRHWVPELAHLQDSSIFEPWLLASRPAGQQAWIQAGYPLPLVTPAAREAAKERIMALREGRLAPRATWWKEREKRKLALRQQSLI